MDDRNNREKIDRARQAAEELFKPARREATGELATATSNGAASPEQPPRRQPRIFAAPPRAPAPATVEAAEPKPIPRKTVGRHRASTVPPAQNGRVRALVTYGMTPAEVAEHYGVAVSEIERIIGGPSALDRPR
jgi:hypothetical protein